MPQQQLIAIGIALRTGVLKICPEHCQIFYDDDVDPALAFALAKELVHRHNPYVAPFAHFDELADMIGDIVSMAPHQCPRCMESQTPLPSRRKAEAVSLVPGRWPATAATLSF